MKNVIKKVFMIPLSLYLLCGGVLLFVCSELYAQTVKKVTGIVQDDLGSPIIGATVVVKGTSLGTVTDLTGKFLLEVPSDANLVITFLGYEPVDIKVNKKNHFVVTLSEKIQGLDEVVITGYGSVRRGDLTGSVGSVKVQDMVKAPVISVGDALAGRIAGVQVSSSDGQPGRSSDIIIRGAGSLTQSVKPVYVVDGFVLDDFDLSSLNPQDIASINILKDASSTAIYGARGANGVVVVTTKTAEIGKPKITYNASFGVNKETKRMEMMNAYEFMRLMIERYPESARAAYYPDLPEGEAMDPEVYRNAPYIDWQDKILRTAAFHTHNLSISGGSEKSKYLASLSYAKQNGPIINTDYDKINGRFVWEQAINKKINLKLNLYFIRDHSSGIVPTDGARSGTATSSFFYSAYGYRPYASLDPEINKKFEEAVMDDSPEISANDFRLNPKVMAENEEKNNINTTFIPSLTLNYNITKHLALLVRGGFDIRFRENNYFYNSRTRLGISRPGIINDGVQGGVTFNNYNMWNNENILSYKNTFNEIHSLTSQIGMSIQHINTTIHSLKYKEIPNEELGLSGIDQGVPVPAQSTISESKSASYFARLDYNLLTRYLFSATIRADGSSKFSKRNRWGYFPSAAIAWRLSGEPFMANFDFIDDLKIRFSYGASGNNRVGDFAYFASIASSYGDYYSFDNQTPSIGFSRKSLGNQNLKWETTIQSNIGLDLMMFNGRINFVMDLYQRNTKDLLLNANLPAVSGFSKGMKNVGKIKNSGLELSLSTVNISNKNFKWLTDFNISFNKSKVLSLNTHEQYMYNYVTWDSQFNNTPLYRTIVGGPITEFWGIEWDGIYQYDDFNLVDGKYILKDDIAANGNPREKIQPGDIKYKDITGDLNVTYEDRKVIGNPAPKHIGGFNNTFIYKNFSLNVFLQWSYGNDIFNANRLYFEGGYNAKPLENQFASFADRWTPENQTNKMFRAGYGGSESGAGPNGVYSSMHIEDGSFLRLKTVSFEYKFPSKLLRNISVKALSIGASAQNLYTWTRYSGLDPEVSVQNTILTPGFDYSSYPRSLSLVFNLKLTL